MNYRLIAPCYFGTESTAAFEVRRLGAEDVQVTDGRIAFSGPASLIAEANLNLRCAERVLLLLKTYTATTFDELFDGVYSVPWEELIPANAQFPVKGSSLSSTLSSVPACQSIVKKAVVERLKKGHRVNLLPEDGPLYKLRFSLRKNQVELMLDTTGDGLHKRGYRRNATGAPIKETLAAAIADLGPGPPGQPGLRPLLRQRHHGDRGRPEGHEHRPRPAPPVCRRAVQLLPARSLGRRPGKGSVGDPAGRRL